MTLSVIVAMAEDRAIGRGNDLPWHLPADLKYFKATTMGKPIVMGRKTFESIGRPLPGRRNIVVTRNADWSADGVDVVPSLQAAKETVADVEEAMIIGGAQIYGQCLDVADRLYITEVRITVPDADAWFPDFILDDWREVSREEHPAEDGKPAYAFVVYDRA
ncbi:dihydrofolate reductase [Kordiimonas lacus]|uniref:Dihydrofolate reductase n=1 Tax=Kordiimonas lacus TaxID=637679 RepID=A0A1G7AXP9_9PROT|nr:dihydrofolate reductase [Kordiimonas lacus]SDE18775.1 dihydrofolate reductase [Kordiimonas lacus]